MEIKRNDLGPIRLKPSEGDSLRSLIFNQFKGSQAEYGSRVGIKPANLSLYLSGAKNLSLELLQRMLSGIGYQVSCQTIIHLVPKETGQNVQDANFVPLEEMSLSEDQGLFN